VDFVVPLSGAASFVQVDLNTGIVYAVSAGGIFKSADRGATWRATAAGAVSSLWIDPADSSLYIITTHGDVVRSRDGGGLMCIIIGRPSHLSTMGLLRPSGVRVIRQHKSTSQDSERAHPFVRAADDPLGMKAKHASTAWLYHFQAT
jgi:hypothetical protein